MQPKNKNSHGRLSAISLFTLICFTPVYGFALPTDAEVISGTATFEQINENTLNITVSADSIINYSSFDIGENETVNFFLPDLDAFSLNRITGGGTSNIFGTLTANGNLILVNTHGFEFGAAAEVNVGGLIASAHDISNENFLAGNYLFKGQDALEASSAFILNNGSILTREGGMAILIADAIENRGTIEAPVGTVALAAGNMVSVGLSEDGLVSIVVDEATANQVLDSEGNPITRQIKNTGTLSAGSGKVSMTARAVDQIFDSLLDSQGIIRADTAIMGKDGVIEIVSSHDIQSTGEISANQGEIILDAGGAVISKGLLETQRLIENGASFLVGGVYKVGLASVQNLDNAVTLDTGNYSGLTSDVANIIVNDNAVITLTGTTTFDADSDDNGTGAFTMNAGSSIAGAGFDLTINTSGNSTLRTIDNVGTLTFGRSASSTPTYTANNSITNLTALSVSTGVNLDLNGNTLSFDSSTAVSNDGTITLIGNETFTNVSNLDINSGTVTYKGDGDAAVDTFTIKDFGATDYYNLTINSTDGATDTYQLGANINIDGNFTNTSGTFDVSASNYSMNVAGNWSNSGTFTARAGTVTMDAGATGKTVTTSGQAFNALVFNGSGGGWTLQDALTAASIQLTAGTLIDNAKTVTVNGNITIANTAGLLTSTGTWIQGASGNISSRANIINELQIANSVTSTRTDRVQTKKLVLGTNATLTGSGEVWVNAAANDFVDMASGASITTGNLAIYPSVGGTLTQKALSTSGANIEVGYRASSTIQMTGNWTTNRDLWVHGTTTSTSEATALVLDTNGYNLNIRGLFMGTQNAGFPNAYQGKVLFRNGTHTLSDGIVLYPGTGGSYGYLDFGSSSISVGGNIDFSSMTVTPGTSTVTLNAAATGKTLKSNGQSFYGLIFNGSGGGWTLQDALTASSIQLTAGNLIDNAKTVTINGDISIGNTSGLLTSTGTWIQGASGNISNPYTSNTTNLFNELQIAGGITSTRTGLVKTKKLVMGNNATLTGAQRLWVQPGSNDFIDLGTGATITSGPLSIIPIVTGTTLTQKAFSIGSTIEVGYQSSVTVQMTGNWTTTSDIWVNGHTSSTSEATALVLDTNGYNLSARGLYLGTGSVSFPNAYYSKIYFRNGTHTFSDIASIHSSVSSHGTHTYLDLGSSNISFGAGVNSNINFASTTITPGTSTVTLNSAGSGKTFNSNGQSFYNFTISGGGSWTLQDAMDVNGNFSLTSGTFNQSTSTMNVAGNFSLSSGSTFTKSSNSSALTFDGAGSLTDSNGTKQDLGAVTISNNSTRTLGAASKMTSLSIGSGSTFALAGNNFDFSSSAPVSNSGNLKLRGSETLTNVSNLDIDSGTVEYVGDGDSAADTYTIKDFGATDYYNLTINSTDGSTDLFRLGANVDINGNFNNAAGSFDVSASNYSMNVAGNWTNSGSFNARAGTVNLDGASQNLFGSTSFFNLTKNVTSAASLTFQAVSTTAVTGTMDLQGAADQLLTLRSSSAGSAWSINPDGLRTVSFLSVRDSHNTNLTTISCVTGCQDGTGNTGWLFSAPATPPASGALPLTTSLRNALLPLRNLNPSNLSLQGLGGLLSLRTLAAGNSLRGPGRLRLPMAPRMASSFSGKISSNNPSENSLE